MSARGAAAAGLALLAAAVLPAPQAATPFRDLRARPLEDRTPGRDDAAPEDLQELRIGWFGPAEADDPVGRDFWSGALLAVDEANAEGGAAGLPVRLVPGWSESPWAGGASRVARMVYEDRVWAIVGSIDGASTHVAEQVVAKALVPLISPGSTDPSVSYAGVPWMFTLLPDDDAQAETLARRLLADTGVAPIALLSTTDHDGRAAAVAVRAALARAGLPLAAHVQCAADATDASATAQLLAAAPRSAILLAPPEVAGRLAAALREAGWAGQILGGASLARRGFREHAGAAAEGALLALPHDPTSEAWGRFARSFAERFGRSPDYTAGSAYDAVRLAVDAARKGGLNRARIRDALASYGAWRGASGEVRFVTLGRNDRPVRLGTIREGRIVTAP